MDKFELPKDKSGEENILSVLEYQGKKVAQPAKKTFNNLYVKDFPKDSDFTNEDFGLLFQRFGKLSSSCIMKDDEGVSRGFGFVCFKSQLTAEKVLHETNRVRTEEQKEEEEKNEIVVKGCRFSDLYIREAKKK